MNVPHKHKQTPALPDGTTVEIGLGLFIANSRSQRTDVPAARAERPTELGMRWAQDGCLTRTDGATHPVPRGPAALGKG